MENLKKEFRSYATKHKGINGTTVDAVIDYHTTKQGWAIFDSDTEIPNEKYHSERTLNGKILNGYYWQVQRLDDPGDDEALFGKLQNDFKADDLARKLGLMVDEYGVVYGFDGQSFL
jgi:hypothetical protein